MRLYWPSSAVPKVLSSITDPPYAVESHGKILPLSNEGFVRGVIAQEATLVEVVAELIMTVVVAAELSVAGCVTVEDDVVVDDSKIVVNEEV